MLWWVLGIEVCHNSICTVQNPDTALSFMQARDSAQLKRQQNTISFMSK